MFVFDGSFDQQYISNTLNIFFSWVDIASMLLYQVNY